MRVKDEVLQNRYEIRIRLHLPDHSDDEKKKMLIKLYDANLFQSDPIVEGDIGQYGFATLVYDVMDQQNVPYERLKDLYFVVIYAGEIIYKSSPLGELKAYKPLIDFARDEKDGHVVCMGSFAVRRFG